MIVDAILSKTQWLYIKIFENQLVFIDYWSFVHCWSGIVLFTILLWLDVDRPRPKLVALLLLYEIVEIAFIYFALDIFRPETLKDQLIDILVGVSGALLARKILYQQYFLHHLTVLFTSVTISFGWVGSYQYHYNVGALNSFGLNWWAFALWSIGIVILLKIWTSLKEIIRHPIVCLTLTWAVHCAVLFLGEYIRHYRG
jgi:uncharacterized membrane protein YeaQ/YmgE (transglycosylase-associated protein family)